MLNLKFKQDSDSLILGIQNSQLLCAHLNYIMFMYVLRVLSATFPVGYYHFSRFSS